MTTATPSAPIESTEAPKAPVAPLDEFGQIAKERLKGTVNELVAKVNLLKAAQGDEQATLDNLRENPPNADAKKYVDAIEDLDNKREALINKLDEILKPLVAAHMEQAQSGAEGLTAEVEALRKKVKAGSNYIKDLYGPEHLEDLPTIPGMRTASAGTTGGSGQRRVRGFDVWVDGVLATSRNAQGAEVSNLAAAAKVLDVSTDDLRSAFFAAAGSDDSKKWPAEVTFSIAAGEGDDRKQHQIVAKRVKENEARATESETPAQTTDSE